MALCPSSALGISFELCGELFSFCKNLIKAKTAGAGFKPALNYKMKFRRAFKINKIKTLHTKTGPKGVST
jgi:hypothetical protein